VTESVEFDLLDVVHMVDGDTFDATVRANDVGELDGWKLSGVKVIRIRPIHLDTAELDEENADLATQQAEEWLRAALGYPGGLRVVVVKQDSFGRYLADVQLASDRSQTLSDYMVREHGWPVWVKPSRTGRK
jgi:endonuclease YncB( thermonuclease family)